MQTDAAISESEFVNRRAAERFTLELPARIGCADAPSAPATLVDLSTSGFRMHARFEAPPGEPVWVRLAGQLPIAARLIWSNEGVHGGAFDEALSPGLVRRLVEQGRVDADPVPERTPELVELLRRMRHQLSS